MIDVGTNSVKVLVADVDGGVVMPVWETSEQTRLGRGFYETHRLQAEPIALTAAAVARFSAGARERGAVSVRVVATSAAASAALAKPGVLSASAAACTPSTPGANHVASPSCARTKAAPLAA